MRAASPASRRRSSSSPSPPRARASARILTQIRALEIALDGVEQEARVGSRTTLDVLDAEQELLNGKVNLVQTPAERDLRELPARRGRRRVDGGDCGLPVTSTIRPSTTTPTARAGSASAPATADEFRSRQQLARPAEFRLASSRLIA
jgi:hypothetical protein